MAADRQCFRCDDPLDDVHRISLASTHEGGYAERFRDVDRRVCLDWLAAIGMLEFAADEDRDEPVTSRLQDPLLPVRLWRGGD